MESTPHPASLLPSCCPEEFHRRWMASTKLWESSELRGYQPGYGTDLYETRICPRCKTARCRKIEIVEKRYPREAESAVVMLGGAA